MGKMSDIDGLSYLKDYPDSSVKLVLRSQTVVYKPYVEARTKRRPRRM